MRLCRDIALLTRIEQDLRKLYEELERATTPLGLEINTSETKYMQITSDRNDRSKKEFVIGN